jgi:hypothetical protein
MLSVIFLIEESKTTFMPTGQKLHVAIDLLVEQVSKKDTDIPLSLSKSIDA